ncbi:MAG: hypothetical protein IJ124_13345 [Clostridia bacterium]|nr:hypothetical protein [Clostridia bacterium]
MKKRNRRNGAPAPGAEDVASATECTGLMPALPKSGAEADASASLYAIPGARDCDERLHKAR